MVCGLNQTAEFHCNLDKSSLALPSIQWTVTNMNTSQMFTRGDSVNQINNTFQINCTEENENVTVQCVVFDIANLSSGIIYGDLITLHIQGKLTHLALSDVLVDLN